MTFLTANSFKKFLSWSILIGWMSVIFWFSAQPGDESGASSQRIIKLFLSWGINLKAIFGANAGFFVRKTAHFTEYFILSWIILFHFKLYNHSFWFAGWIFASLFSITDEFHQAFVPGRAPAIFDVFVDSSGAFIANILSYFTVKKHE